MGTLSIAKKHHLTHKKAKEAAQKIADDLHARFGLSYEWRGDCIEFKRPGLTGELHVGATDVSLDCDLGFLLTAFKPVFEAEINKEFGKYFGKAGKTK